MPFYPSIESADKEYEARRPRELKPAPARQRTIDPPADVIARAEIAARESGCAQDVYFLVRPLMLDKNAELVSWRIEPQPACGESVAPEGWTLATTAVIAVSVRRGA